MKRNFDTKEATQDIKFTYTTYEVQAIIQIDSIETDARSQFETKQVDYAYFKEPELGALSGITISAFALLVSGISLIFWSLLRVYHRVFCYLALCIEGRALSAL